ncbi:hypothetical protein ACFIJ5_14525 [Haloimpatiens sp. FM7330]|uniref:hypothetical protein n=1 Tax=Haloimpatiens sp. FM7330 TaxID=3298610 RepID=UPI00362B0E64
MTILKSFLDKLINTDEIEEIEEIKEKEDVIVDNKEDLQKAQVLQMLISMQNSISI